jgi:LmbE family N-acetylglucosaminyl deacetylase
LKTAIKNKLAVFTRFLVGKKVKKLPDFSPILNEYNKILIIAPHPDDEIIGLGGLILESLKQKKEVYFLFLTDGEASGAHSSEVEIKNARKSLTNQICAKLGIPKINVCRFSLVDGRVPHMKDKGFVEICHNLVTLINEIQPQVIFATHPMDYWPYDHVACAAITKEAVKQSKLKVDLYFYWVWAWYHLKPWQILKLDFKNYYKIDITQNLTQKKALIDAYIEPLTPEGKPWSGVLPASLLKGNTQKHEVIEKIKY